MSFSQNSPFKPSQESGLDVSKLVDTLFDRIYTLEQAVNAIGYDSKASKKRRFPAKRQESVLKGITRALCVETIDPLKMNRVRFFHPLIHNPSSTVFALPFAKPVSSMGGFDDCGLNWVPPAGSTLLVFFEKGVVDSAFYLGTTWHKNRGPKGSGIMRIFPSREYQSVYDGHRKGYLVGPDDESQVYPPWNTESYNSGDIYNTLQYSLNPNEQKRSTYPNIYGFKTPEKHMLKMVDGNAKCNRRWKRMELMSSCGNWMIFKDDHLHYGGQWSNPKCPPNPGGQELATCSEHKGILPYYSDFHGEAIEKSGGCEPNCACPTREGESCGPQCSKILGGHTSTPCDPETKYCDSQKGANPFFKHKNECRPYKGPGTPQNNRCDLPQTGIQFLSISGHSWVMDDSVEEPSGSPLWERSMQNFDFGCNDKFLGRTYWKSATGHQIMISDIEEQPTLRGNKNFIKLLTATGNRIELNDHTVGDTDCTPCPPNYAGEDRGIHLQSTSNHVIKMIDHMNKQCAPCRTEGGKPISKATKAYIQIRSGYGLEMRYNDDFSQEETQQQWIQILHPQCVNPNTDDKCNSKSGCGYRGPHLLRFQGRPKGQPGVVYLRAGGHAIRQTYDMDVVLVGDKECNPSDKFTYVSKKHIRVTEDVDFRYSGELHIFFAEKRILLLAGRDCPPKPPKKCKGPCVYGVIIARCPFTCPLTRVLHWSKNSVSERVFASGWTTCPPDEPGFACKPCVIPGCEHPEPDPPTTSIDTGNGVITI
jgi:hypothetical protein